MKVAYKHCPMRDDCFSATERGSKVVIRSYRNVVQIEVSSGGIWTEHEMNLTGFAEMLLKCVSDDKQRVTGAQTLNPNQGEL